MKNKFLFTALSTTAMITLGSANAEILNKDEVTISPSGDVNMV